MRKSNYLFPALAIGLTAVSCQDYDAGFTEADFVKKEYSDTFKQLFGDVDPNQNWSMAQQVTANVSGVEDGILEIYYSDPIGGQPIMLTQQKISGGEATVKFDVVKGTKTIFARINDGTGYYSMKSHFQIVDGEVNICPSMTRIGLPPTGTSRVTKVKLADIVSPQVVNWDAKGSELHLYPQAEESFYINGTYGIEDNIGNISTLYMDGPSGYFTEGTFKNVYMLYNVINDEDERPEWYLKDIAPFFTPIDGHEAVFAEGVNHVKFMKDGSYPQLEKDLVFEMDEAGAFCLDYFAKGTSFDNQFGYFYFTGDNPTPEHFMTLPKYILVDNMSNTSKEGIGSKVTTTAAGVTKDWDLLKTKSPLGWTTTYDSSFDYATESDWDKKVVGTRLQLTYFGADGTGEGTYTFPAGTKIGLFILGNGNHRNNEFITSIADLNLKMFNEYPHAAAFQYNDQVVYAMEDQHHAGDADVNDVMFIVNAKVKKTNIPQIDPVKPTFPTWIVACEDLGGTFDYDFNDVVFGLRKEDKAEGPSDLYLVPLAAGGTLEANIIYNGTKLGEIHDLIMAGSGFTAPLNVGAGSNPGAGAAIKLGTVAKGTSIPDCAKMINIQVTKDDATSENNKTYNVGYKFGGSYEAPQAIILPPGWDWPSELTHIWDVYEGIKSWVTDADVTTWCGTKKAGASIVHNPLPAVPVPSEPSQGEDTPTTPETPTVDPTKPYWGFTVNGYPTMEKGATQTLTVTIDGVNDYTGLTFGTYSTDVITATAVEGHPNQFTITGVTNGTALFWVKMPSDDTHNLTRLDYEITVTNPTPSFDIKIGDEEIEDGGEYTYVYDAATNYNPVFEVKLPNLRGDANKITFVSSKESVATTNGWCIRAAGLGTTVITIKHAAGSDGTTTWGTCEKSFTLHVVGPSSDEDDENDEDDEDDDSKDPVDVTPVTILNSDVTVNGNNGSAKLTLDWPESSNGYTKLVVSLTPTGDAKIQFKSEWSNSATNEIDVPADATSIEIPLLTNGISILQTQGGAYVWNNSANTFTITKIELQ